jgi:hypothetical protein
VDRTHQKDGGRKTDIQRSPSTTNLKEEKTKADHLKDENNAQTDRMASALTGIIGKRQILQNEGLIFTMGYSF